MFSVIEDNWVYVPSRIAKNSVFDSAIGLQELLYQSRRERENGTRAGNTSMSAKQQ